MTYKDFSAFPQSNSSRQYFHFFFRYIVNLSSISFFSLLSFSLIRWNTKAFGSIAMDLTPRLGTLKASVFLHKTLLHAMTRAQLMFFDQTPIGRILSRFGSDVEAADNKIPEIVSDGMACFFEVTNISSHFIFLPKPFLLQLQHLQAASHCL